MSRKTIAGMVVASICLVNPAAAQKDQLTPFGKVALEESVVPVRSGIPGILPFWNQSSRQFIYAPSFNYKAIDPADRYQYQIVSQADGRQFSFESRVPHAPLSPVWTEYTESMLRALNIN